MKEMAFKPTLVDHDYLKTMGMKAGQAGRDFFGRAARGYREQCADQRGSAVKRMNWTEPIGKKIMLGTVPADGKEPAADRPR
jgi:putative ABC transport system permease protein